MQLQGASLLCVYPHGILHTCPYLHLGKISSFISSTYIHYTRLFCSLPSHHKTRSHPNTKSRRTLFLSSTFDKSFCLLYFHSYVYYTKNYHCCQELFFDSWQYGHFCPRATKTVCFLTLQKCFHMVSPQDRYIFIIFQMLFLPR